jgi:hypothetical protein
MVTGLAVPVKRIEPRVGEHVNQHQRGGSVGFRARFSNAPRSLFVHARSFHVRRALRQVSAALVAFRPTRSHTDGHGCDSGRTQGKGERVSDLLGMMEPPLMAGCTATAVSVSISSNVTVISVVLSAQSACGRYLPNRARALAQRGAGESVWLGTGAVAVRALQRRC